MKKPKILLLAILSISFSFYAGLKVQDADLFGSATKKINISCDYYNEDPLMRAFICERDLCKKMGLLEKVLEDKYSRWSWLDDASELAYDISYYEKARMYALESISKADDQADSWNYGNAIHNSNSVLGMLSLINGDLEKAKNYLLEASKSKGSPQLNSFGPRLELANELLKLGEKDVVLIYLNSVESYWEMDEGSVSRWKAEIGNGEIPYLCNQSCEKVNKSINYAPTAPDALTCAGY